jgi:hypothetical protein
MFFSSNGSIWVSINPQFYADFKYAKLLCGQNMYTKKVFAEKQFPEKVPKNRGFGYNFL